MRRYAVSSVIAAVVIFTPLFAGASAPAATGWVGPVRTAPIPDAPPPEPALFEANGGQLLRPVRFRVRVGDTATEFRTDGLRLTGQPGDAAVRVVFPHASREVRLVGKDRRETTVTYLLGNDRRRWHSGIPTYAGVTYQGLWPGIDLTYSVSGGHVKGVYTLAPRVNPAVIGWSYPGATASVGRDGSLLVTRAGATMTERPPVAWQTKAGRRFPVGVRYTRRSDGSAAFTVGQYDRTLPLAIDPTIVWARTADGYNPGGAGCAVAVDGAGNVVSVNEVPSYGVLGPKDPLAHSSPDSDRGQRRHDGDFDAQVLKYDRNGKLLWMTYLGGSSQDLPYGVDVDAAGRIGFVGQTTSKNFPTTRGEPGADRAHDDGLATDSFAGMLSPDGRTLVFSTYIASPAQDQAFAARFRPNGDLVVTGSDFHYMGLDGKVDRRVLHPVGGAFHVGGADAFVADYTPTGRLRWQATLGEDRWRDVNPDGTAIWHDGPLRLYGLTLGPDGSVYVTGPTHSHYTTITAGQQPRPESDTGWTGYVAKLSADGRRLLWARYLGDAATPGVVSAAVDQVRGQLWLWSQSSSFPGARCGGPAGTVATNYDALAVRLDLTSGRLRGATCVGGSSAESVGLYQGDSGPGYAYPDIAVDPAGNAYALGATGSPDFPIIGMPWQRPVTFQSANFVISLSPLGALRWSVLLDGTGDSAELNGGLALGPEHRLAVVSDTRDPFYPQRNPTRASPEGDVPVVTILTDH